MRRDDLALDLSKVGKRDELKVQPEPHWQRLSVGCYLGFRPSKVGGAGSWIGRIYDVDARKYRVKSLGDYGALAKNKRFMAAKRDAESLAELVETGGVVRRQVETVGDACRAYAETRPDAQGRFKRYIYGHPVAKVKLEKLRFHHLRDWREALENKPALISRNKDGATESRKRAPATINRDMVVLRAALNTVLPHGTPKTPAAWQEALVAIPNASKRRTLYLDRNQRRLLLEHINDEPKPFVMALCLLPIRPGAMAQLTAGDFDGRTSELTIGQDKSGNDRRIIIPADTADFFAKQTKDKLPSAPLFMRANGKPWDRHSWKIPIADGAEKASLPIGTSAYTLRHSTITDLVKAKLPLLTIAQISGTSAAMIEQHYGHLARDAAVRALETLSL